MTRRANLQLRADAIIRDELSQSTLPLVAIEGSAGTDKDGREGRGGGVWDRAESPHIVRTVECSKLFSSENTEEEKRKRVREKVREREAEDIEAHRRPTNLET